MNIRLVFFYRLLRPLVRLFLFFNFGYRCKVAKNLPENYIVLSNHNTDYDPLLVGASFPRQMYFVASEHISRWKNAYKFVKFLFEPILRYKGTVAGSTVLEIMRTIRDGGNVCIFAEGARSWDGVSSPILPSTGKMVKSAKCALVTYRIEGGYFISPNWSEANTRRGRIYGAPVNVYTAEQLASMSVDEINEAIRSDLYEDAYARQLADPVRYTGKNLAVRMENLLFICPECGARDTISSQNDTVSCSACGMQFRYTEYGMLDGIAHTTVQQLSQWQKQCVAQDAENGMSYEAPKGSMSKVVKHAESAIAEGLVTMNQDVFSCGDVSIPVNEITNFSMHGRHALVFSTKDAYYEVLVADKKNALKFFLLYEAMQNAKVK